MTDRFTLEMIDLSLRETVNKTFDLFIEEAHRKGLKYTCHIDGLITNSFQGDSDHLHQTLSHLISNAVTYTEQGAVTVSVALLDQNEDSELLGFEVRDTGMGIGKSKLYTILESRPESPGSAPQNSADSARGLDITRQLVQLMGSKIEAVSHPGRGSSFSFAVRMQRSSAKIPGHPAQASLLTDSGETDASMQAQVLLVEDNPVNQKVAVIMLELLGCSVEIAENGQIAVDLLSENRYDLVFMDIQMPVMDGLEATRTFREREKQKNEEIRPLSGAARIPIIALTAHAMPGDREKCLNSGMDDYLQKPFNKKQLETMLIRWLPVRDQEIGGRQHNG